MAETFVLLAVLLALSYNWGSGGFWNITWNLKWFAALALASLFLSWRLARPSPQPAKRFPQAAAVLLVWASLSCASVVAYHPNRYASVSVDQLLSVKATGGYAWLAILLLALAVRELPVGSAKRFLNLYGGLCLVLSLHVLWAFFVTHEPPNRLAGWFGNSSFNATVIAVALPWLSPWLWPVPVLAVLLSGSSMGVLVLLAGGAARLAASRKSPWLLPAIFVAGVGAAFLLRGVSFAHDSNRYGLWKWALSWQWGEEAIFMGLGPGVSQVLLPLIQQQYNYAPKELFIFWHNDWLQIFFELGLVGLGLSGWLYVSALKQAWRRPQLFSGLLAFGVAMCGQYPLHQAATAWLACLLLRESFLE